MFNHSANMSGFVIKRADLLYRTRTETQVKTIQEQSEKTKMEV